MDSESFRHMITPSLVRGDVIPAHAYPSQASTEGLPFRRMVTPLRSCIERNNCCFFLSFAPSIKGYMAPKAIAMEPVKQILPLYQDGFSIKAIVRLTGISRPTVKKYLRRYSNIKPYNKA